MDAFGPGFLGPVHAPLIVGDNQFDNGQRGANIDAILKVADLDRPKVIDDATHAARLDMLREMQEEFATGRPGATAKSHAAAYDRAIRLMQSEGGKVFDLTTEKAETRDKYGRNLFGQGCLLARRLVEKGVPFVEVTLNGWDTHANNAQQVRTLSQTVDPAWASLMTDLKATGLWDETLLIWGGEFGRTPTSEGVGKPGRDHNWYGFSMWLAGAGVKGGQAIGATDELGFKAVEDPCHVSDLHATILHLMGLEHERLTYFYGGLNQRLTGFRGNVIEKVLA